MDLSAQVTYIYCGSNIYLKFFFAQLPCASGIYMKLLLNEILICQCIYYVNLNNFFSFDFLIIMQLSGTRSKVVTL